MRALRPLLAVFTVLAILLAAPAASLATCLRCPPDCPMHAVRDAGGAEHGEDVGAEHAGVWHGSHHARSQDGPDAGHPTHAPGHARDGDCHHAAAPEPEQGPCLSGVCGHMDPSLVVALPPGLMPPSSAVDPARVVATIAPGISPGPLAGLPEPPAEPPRPLLA